MTHRAGRTSFDPATARPVLPFLCGALVTAAALVLGLWAWLHLHLAPLEG